MKRHREIPKGSSCAWMTFSISFIGDMVTAEPGFSYKYNIII